MCDGGEFSNEEQEEEEGDDEKDWVKSDERTEIPEKDDTQLGNNDVLLPWMVQVIILGTWDLINLAYFSIHRALYSVSAGHKRGTIKAFDRRN